MPKVEKEKNQPLKNDRQQKHSLQNICSLAGMLTRAKTVKKDRLLGKSRDPFGDPGLTRVSKDSLAIRKHLKKFQNDTNKKNKIKFKNEKRFALCRRHQQALHVMTDCPKNSTKKLLLNHTLQCNLS
ncbi:MAG: hypothetical protein ACJ75B_12170 [Flavisolibacter sp.]